MAATESQLVDCADHRPLAFVAAIDPIKPTY